MNSYWSFQGSRKCGCYKFWRKYVGWVLLWHWMKFRGRLDSWGKHIRRNVSEKVITLTQMNRFLKFSRNTKMRELTKSVEWVEWYVSGPMVKVRDHSETHGVAWSSRFCSRMLLIWTKIVLILEFSWNSKMRVHKISAGKYEVMFFWAVGEGPRSFGALGRSQCSNFAVASLKFVWERRCSGQLLLE